MRIPLLQRPVHAASPTPDVHVPDGALDTWYAAKAAAEAGTGYADWFAISDSTGMGQPNGATPAQDSFGQSWYGLLRAFLSGKMPLAADYFGPGESAAIHSAAAGQGIDYNWTSLGGPPLVYAGTAAANTGGWMKNVTTDRTGADPSTPFLTATTPGGCIGIDILYALYFSSLLSKNWSYQVDALAAVQKTSPAGQTVKAQRESITGLAAGAHTLKLAQAVASSFEVLGLVANYRAGSGMRCGRMAMAGRTLGDWTCDLDSPADKVANLFGDFDGTNYQSAQGFPTAPHLGIVSLGINDNNQTFPARCLTPGGAFRALCHVADNARRGRRNMSLVVIGNFYPLPPNNHGVNIGDSGGWTRWDTWPEYLAAFERACRAKRMVFVNMASRWGSDALAQGFVSANDNHPTAAGHADIAAALTGVL